MSGKRIDYSEEVKVYARSGDLIGSAHFTGYAHRPRTGGLWSWNGRLTQTDFEPGAVMEAGELRLDFSDGASGNVLCTKVQITANRRGTFGWVEILGNGMPPRVEPD